VVICAFSHQGPPAYAIISWLKDMFLREYVGCILGESSVVNQSLAGQGYGSYGW
jgi:hypothetical protein